VFAEIAAARGVSPQQVCLAWELAKSPTVVPIPGASRPESILDSVRAADLTLTEDECAVLDADRE
jgi:aryl-alcohol dehydrogenase-like predicted oxidoreductase